MIHITRVDAILETAGDAEVVSFVPVTVVAAAPSPEKSTVVDLMQVLAPADVDPLLHLNPSSKQEYTPTGHVVQTPFFGLEKR